MYGELPLRSRLHCSRLRGFCCSSQRREGGRERPSPALAGALKSPRNVFTKFGTFVTLQEAMAEARPKAGGATSAYSTPTTPPPTKEYVERARQNLVTVTADQSATAAQDTAIELVREYTVWPTRNTFCCWGYCMTGPEEDVGPNTCAWMLILTPMALFFYTWGGALARTSNVLLVIVVISFASCILWLLVTSFTDPGILPRNNDPAVLAQAQPPLYRTRTDESGASNRFRSKIVHPAG